MLRGILNTCKRAAQGLTLGVDPAAVVLFQFSSPKVVDQWHVFTDAFFGGKSAASLQYNAEQQAAEFSGRVTLEQEEDADIKRAGYCVAASKVVAIGQYFDLSGCSTLVYEVCGDGRTYVANVRTDSIAGTGGDVWQAPFKTLPGVWARVTIPISSLALTYQGQLVQQRLEFQADKVIGVGVAASALPSAEADGEGAAASTNVEACGRGGSGGASGSSGGEDAAVSGSNSSSSSSSSSIGSDCAAPAADGSQPGGSGGEAHIPEHERFRLLIRSIRADVE